MDTLYSFVQNNHVTFCVEKHIHGEENIAPYDDDETEAMEETDEDADEVLQCIIRSSTLL